MDSLRDYDTISIHGPDAVDFVHAQTANDVKALGVGCWQWNCQLSPQGRVLALMLLARTAPEELTAVVANGRGADLAAHWRRFVLRSRVTITLASERHCYGRAAMQTPAALALGGAMTQQGSLWSVELAGAKTRQLLLGPAAEPAENTAGVSAAWRSADMIDGIPWITPATADRFTPQALSLERLQAFSVRKGCYPGQEIVARTHYLGRSKRRLARIEPDGPVVVAAGAGTEIYAASPGITEAVGTVIAWSSDAEISHGLAVLDERAGDRVLLGAGGPSLQVHTLA